MSSGSTIGNALGTIGTVLWCIQLIPQIIHNYRKKSCIGLSPLMLFLWSASGVPFSIYFVSRGASIPIKIQPQLFTALSLVTWWQSLYYPPVSKNWKKATLYVTAFVVISVGLEVGCILSVRKAYNRGMEWPSLIFGILASVLLAIGLVPPYFELAKRKGRVVGINFIFLTLDFNGAFFSALSLAFEADLDILGLVLYIIVAAMELGLFTSHFIWWLRFGRKISQEQEDGDMENQLRKIRESEDNISNLETSKTVYDESETTKSIIT